MKREKCVSQSLDGRVWGVMVGVGRHEFEATNRTSADARCAHAYRGGILCITFHLRPAIICLCISRFMAVLPFM